MRRQFPMTSDGRAVCVVPLEAGAVERVNQIIEQMCEAAVQVQVQVHDGSSPQDGNQADPLGTLESLVAYLPEGVSLSYNRHLWHKDQFAVYQDGRRVEVIYRHSGNSTITYMQVS